MHTEVGQQVGRFALRGNRTLFFFIFADPSLAIPDGFGAQKQLLRQRFAASGWECPQILSALDSAKDLYFDRVSQIRIDSKDGFSWTRGRVTLVGDAAWCVSLLGGQGSAIAMAGTYILAGELHRAAGDYKTAFARYENQFEAFVMRKQHAALKFAGTFAPKSRASMLVRNAIMNLLRIPWIADFVLNRALGDNLKLPEY
jgi:2-polyprenyl-6-methoxyphenol hydroxylase-like FAD-dependent oxidoreductase